MLRIGTLEDFDLTLSMALEFAHNTDYSKFTNDDQIKELVKEFLLSDGISKIVLLYEDKGMIAGVVTPFMFGQHFVGTEVAWWVKPEVRGQKVGEELLKAFEYWAKKVGCSMVAMIGLGEELDKFYKSKGYKLCELSYMKEI